MRIALLISAVTIALCGPAAAESGPLAAKLTDAYGPAVAQNILASSETLLDTQPQPGDSPNNTALQCFAALKLIPQFGGRALRTVEADADMLVAISGGANGEVGWSIKPDHVDSECGVPGEQSTAHMGCNPAGTKYAFRTALALACVAKAYAVTHKKEYLDTALAAVRSSWLHGAPTPNCANCFSYWMSYDPKDVGRYVRNVNILMAWALGAVYEDTKDPRILARIREVANSERRESAAGNEGYYGVADPQYRAKPERERVRIENHDPYLALARYDVGNTLNDEALKSSAAAILRTWLDCPESYCGGKTCKQWGGSAACNIEQDSAPCYFRRFGGEFAARCAQFLTRNTKFNHYEIWMALSGLD